MQITRLHITGYRTLYDVTWQPGRLNVLIGPNASGKSNLLQSLRMIRASSLGRLQDFILEQGGMGSVMWDTGAHPINVLLTLDDPTTAHSTVYDYELVLEQLGGSAAYNIEVEQLLSADREGHDVVQPAKIVSRSPFGASFSANGQSQQMSASEFTPGETVLSRLKAGVAIPPLIVNVASTLASWSIYDDFRTDRSAPVRRPVIVRNVNRLDDDAQNLASVLHTFYETDADFRDRIDMAMTAAFGDNYVELTFPPAGSQNIELCVRWKSVRQPQSAAVLSDGTLRFLMLVTALSVPELPSLVCIDEPEAGLHPTMMRIISEYAADAALRSQIIFTTHSAAFLDAFSKDESPTTTVTEISYGETKLSVVDPDLLSRWLEDYSLGTLYRTRELEQMPAAKEIAA